ncbi:MAG: hypothetical protein R3F19_18325 [Verrucomicrobiales bacterium]
MSDDERLVTRGWLRRRWSCAINTIRHFEQTGELTPIRLVNRVQYRLSEIKQLEAEGIHRPPTRNDVSHLPHHQRQQVARTS